jgi:hypothetical protein
VSGPLQSLFDSVERTDASPRLYAEDNFAFLNRASGVVWERIRRELDSWYAGFPDADDDLRRRFQNRDPRQHYAAWWELYLHRLFTRLEYRVNVHPSVPGTSGRPDFLVERSGIAFYVEAVTVFSGIVAQGRRGRLEAVVLDLINTIDASLFFVSVNFDRVGEKTPRAQAIVGPIAAWLKTIDADELLTCPADQLPTREFSIEGWELSLRALPRSPEFREREDNQLIGIGPASAGFTNDRQQLYRALTRKKKQCGKPDKPLVVAALATNGFMDNHEIEGALFGSEAVRVHIATGASTITRQPDGFWVGKRGVSAKRVSALLMGVSIIPETCASRLPAIWHHFDPTYKLDADLPFPRMDVIDDQLQLTAATRHAYEVMDLDENWPGLWSTSGS